MKKLLSACISSTMHFFYPSFCLHCHSQTFGKDKWICKSCFEQIEWIDSTFTCKVCGTLKRERAGTRCATCKTSPKYLMPFSACFLPQGPAYHLHEYLRVYESEEVAKIFASLLIIKWQTLTWPFPDAIVPIPDSRLETFSLKRQPNHLIAKALSKMLKTRFKPVLTPREKQSGVGFQPKAFFCRDLTNQTVYLISDVVRASETYYLARKAVLSLLPKAIYTLVLFESRR